MFRALLSRQARQAQSIGTSSSRQMTSTAARRAAAPEQAKAAAEGAGKTAANWAEKAKEAAGPLAKRAEGLLGAYYEPLVYNARVLGNVMKQVYIAESLAPPKSLKTVVDAYRTLWARAADKAFYGKLLANGEWKKVAIYGIEAYGIFTIGEMIGRRSLVGYKLETHGDAHHH